jgi:hypothetical protein
MLRALLLVTALAAGVACAVHRVGPNWDKPEPRDAIGGRVPVYDVRGSGRSRATGSGGGHFCNSSIDCGGGAFCKDRGDGIRICMGDGARDDFCHSSIDCAGGMLCKDRGDGMKVCM